MYTIFKYKLKIFKDKAIFNPLLVCIVGIYILVLLVEIPIYKLKTKILMYQQQCNIHLCSYLKNMFHHIKLSGIGNKMTLVW